MQKRADLHCHSTCSDGTFTPRELILLAKEKKLFGLSITDHDTIAAYDHHLFAFAAENGIKLCNGIEFSCSAKGRSVHILGYAFQLPCKTIKELCAQHAIRRQKRNAIILKKLHKLGMTIKEEELQSLSISVVGRPHIAKLMVQKGYVQTEKEAFCKFLGESKPAYDPGPEISVVDSIGAIHQSGGKAFIAHPHLIKSKNLVKYLLTLPFDGIECYYAKFHSSEEEKWLSMAKEKDLLISGGSDFHGALKPEIELGCSWTSEENFRKIVG